MAKPRLSRAVRETAARLGVSDRSSSLPNKVRLMYISISPWRHLPLTVHLSAEYRDFAREKCEPPPGTPIVGRHGRPQRAAAFDEREDDDEQATRTARRWTTTTVRRNPRDRSRGPPPRARGARCAATASPIAARRATAPGAHWGAGRWVGCPGCGGSASTCLAARFFERPPLPPPRGEPAPPATHRPDVSVVRPRTLVGRGGGGGAATRGNRTERVGMAGAGARDPIRVRAGGRRAGPRRGSVAGRGSRSARARGRGDVVAEGGESGGVGNVRHGV